MSFHISSYLIISHHISLYIIISNHIPKFDSLNVHRERLDGLDIAHYTGSNIIRVTSIPVEASLWDGILFFRFFLAFI